MLVPLSALWMPILLAAVIVFIASAVVWMALPHHKTDFKRMPAEESVLEAMRASPPAAGEYMFPFCKDRSKMNDPEIVAKFDKGPVGIMTVMQNGMPPMGMNMALQFVYFLAVSVLVAYIGAVTLEPGTEYLKVFQVIGTAAILAYAAAHVPRSIWFQRPWANTFKEVFDGVLYGLLTAGVFGWLWPA